MAASHARAKARFSAMGIVVKKPNVPIMTAVSRRKTARKVMQPKGDGNPETAAFAEGSQNQDGNAKREDGQR